MMNELGGLNVLEVLVVNLAAVNLRNYLRDISVQEFVQFVKTDRDLSVELPMNFTIPNIQFAKNGIIHYLKTCHGPVLYEYIRIRLGQWLPVHSELLGLDSARGWYYQNMDKIKALIILNLEGGKVDTTGKDNVDSAIGAGDSGRGGAPGVLLLQQEQGFGDSGTDEGELQM